MALKIGVVAQKGGVGKSTLSRMIACEYASSGWEVKIADMDTAQSTCFEWQEKRLERGIEPTVSVEQFKSVSRVLRIEDKYDLIAFDGAPRATATTEDIARVSDLVIIPTGVAEDDLFPTIRLAHELKSREINREKIAIAFCRVGKSPIEIEEATEFVEKAGYYILGGAIPESTGYRRAHDAGKCATETRFKSLNEKAWGLMQSIVDRVGALTTPVVAYHG